MKLMSGFYYATASIVDDGHPRIRSRLVIHKGFVVDYYDPKPCWWYRLWYRLLLGWRWEDEE